MRPHFKSLTQFMRYKKFFKQTYVFRHGPEDTDLDWRMFNFANQVATIARPAGSSGLSTTATRSRS